MAWAAHRNAAWFLAMLSFAESSFFPVPPDVMLAPMVLARRKRAWVYAMITTLASAAGGIAGYFIGLLAFDAVASFLHSMGYWQAYLTARDWFSEWGVWVIFIAGFSPIPYKVFTISAGAVSMAFLPFVIASVIGRGARFFLVAALMYWGGKKMDQFMRQYIDRIGWLFLVLVILIYFLVR